VFHSKPAPFGRQKQETQPITLTIKAQTLPKISIAKGMQQHQKQENSQNIPPALAKEAFGKSFTKSM